MEQLNVGGKKKLKKGFCVQTGGYFALTPELVSQHL